MKRVITLVLISVGIFVGIVMPNKTPEDVLGVSRSINKIPSFDYWEYLYEDYCGSFDQCPVTQSSTKVFNIINFNIGESGTYYLYLSSDLYESIQQSLQNVDLADYSEFYGKRWIYISNSDASYTYDDLNVAVVQDSNQVIQTAQNIYVNETTHENRNRYFGDYSLKYLPEFQYDPTNDVYYTYYTVSHPTNVQVALHWSEMPALNNMNIKIQMEKASTFSGFVEYVPYNKPYEVNSGVIINNIYYDKTSVTLGESYNLVIDIENPKHYNFYSVKIDGDEFKVDTTQSTNELGDQYILKIPFTSSITYGDIIHTVQQIIMRHDNEIDYDIIEINQNLSLTSIESFTDNVVIDKVTIANNEIFITENNQISINMKNPDNVPIDSISVNNILYRQYTVEQYQTVTKIFSTNEDTKFYTINTDPILLDGVDNIENVINLIEQRYPKEQYSVFTQLASSIIYVHYINQPNYTLIQNEDGSFEDMSYGKLTSGTGVYDWYTASGTKSIYVSSTMPGNYYTYPFIYNTGDIIFNTGESISASIYDREVTKYTFDVNMPTTVGSANINLDYIKFYTTLDKTYYSNYNVDQSFTVLVKNPVYLNDINVIDLNITDSISFNNQKVPTTINITNPSQLNLREFYINDVLITDFVINDLKTQISFELDLNLLNLYGANDLYLTKLIFTDLYNGVELYNTLQPPGIYDTINIVNYNFSDNVSINSISYDKDYYLYGDIMELTININNPNNIKVFEVIIDNISYSASIIDPYNFIVYYDVPTAIYGNIEQTLQSIIFEKDSLKRKNNYNKTFNYELYSSNSVADVNILNFAHDTEEVYLYNDTHYLTIELGNTTRLIPRSITLNGIERTDFNIDETNKIITIPVKPITDTDIKEFIYTLDSMTFYNLNQLATKTINMNEYVSVVNTYKKQVDEIEEYEMNGLNKIIFLTVVNPMLSNIFPFIDNITLKYPNFIQLLSTLTLIMSCALVTFVMFRKEISNLNIIKKLKFKKR